MDKFYDLAAFVAYAVRKKCGFGTHVLRRKLDTGEIHMLKAIRTGDFRAPLKGEWYLSGSVPAAYKAPNDFDIKFYIAKLVLVEEKTVTTYKVIEV